jgi:hypothetical protein
MPDISYVEYLRRTYEQNAKFATEANLRSAQHSQEVIKEKTQYIEKIALAAGGTLALVVSFVGAHAGRLQPPWLLRSALVTLVLTMIAAMARNWRQPYYSTANYNRQYANALLNEARAKRDLFVVVPTQNPDTMQLHDPESFRTQFAKDERILNEKLAESQKQEDSAFQQTKWLEQTALVLIIAAMAMLIALAWINF